MSSQHEALLSEYERELDAAVRLALEERETKIHSIEELEGIDESRARERLEAAPIASDGFVVAVVRKFWLALDELNRSLPVEQRVEAESFLDDALRARNRDLGEVIAALPYWPVGQDASGRWV